MASPFLEGLKKSVESGEFNSDVAKKIIELDKLADTKNDTVAIEKLQEEVGVKSIDAEEFEKLNSDYEKKMQEIREKDLVLQQIAMLQSIEETVRLTVYDMRDFIKDLEDNFKKDNPNHVPLFLEIEKIKSKYNSIIN
jgi:hypothetical protein